VAGEDSEARARGHVPNMDCVPCRGESLPARGESDGEDILLVNQPGLVCSRSHIPQRYRAIV